MTDETSAAKRRLTISLSAEDYEAVRLLADQQERSLSWMISDALKSYLQRIRQTEPDRLLGEGQTRLEL